MLRAVLGGVALLLAAPVLAIAASWLFADGKAWAVLTHQASTVLGDYTLQTLWLALGTAVGAGLLGTSTAVLVALTRFAGRGLFEWALLLPLAMPAYVLAYAYTDALQFSGPLQTVLRAALQREGALWPDVRSLWGAILLFSLCLYPYVYLLTRAALGERATALMESAQMLGAGWRERLWRVALPLARPAIAAGLALVMMETLADYGVAAYFGLSTFSTGIYRAWSSMNSPVAAAQLASILLLAVALLLTLEQRSRARLRYAERPSARAGTPQRLALPAPWALLAMLWCALPVLLGFALPALWLAHLTQTEAGILPWAQFGQWAVNSLGLAALAAALATALALGLLSTQRLAAGGAAWREALLNAGGRVLALGYALPGTVVAVGLLLPLSWLGDAGGQLTVLLTGSVAALMLAYVLRFSALALQTLGSGFARIPPSVDDSAHLLGASPAAVLGRIHLPLLRRSLLAAALLVFVDTMKELPATLMLRPFGSDTLAVGAFNFARDERLAEAALPALAIVLVGLLPVVLLARGIAREPAS